MEFASVPLKKIGTRLLCADVAYRRKLANELGFLQLCPTVIHEDNIGAKQHAKSGNFKGRSKHFELRWRFLYHYINRGIISITAVKRMFQLADVAHAALRNLQKWALPYMAKPNVFALSMHSLVRLFRTFDFFVDSIRFVIRLISFCNSFRFVRNFRLPALSSERGGV